MDINLEERNRIRKYHFTQLFTIRERIILRRNSSKLELRLRITKNWRQLTIHRESVTESRAWSKVERAIIAIATIVRLSSRFLSLAKIQLSDSKIFEIAYIICGKNLDKRTKNSSSNF